MPSQAASKFSPEQRFSFQAAAIDLLQQYADFHAARLACDDALAAVDQLPKPVAETASARFSLLRSRPSVAAATASEAIQPAARSDRISRAFRLSSGRQGRPLAALGSGREYREHSSS